LLEFSDAAQRFLAEHKIHVTHVSLADEEDHAVAFVTLEAP
jgi:phosphopantetheinyl transferase (holo-ACP synthase)